MRSLVWVDGRLSWPLVILIAYVSALMVIFDFCWRILVMPFDQLVLYAVIIGALGAAAITVLVVGHSRGRRGKISFKT